MSVFRKGYDTVLYDILIKRGYYMASCLSCRYYDKGCENIGVLEYDKVKDGAREYCIFWLPPPTKKGE